MARSDATSGGRALIVGAATHWGSELARNLAKSGKFQALIGLDTSIPDDRVDGMEYVEADIRDPTISRILPALDPDVVIHCGIVWYPEDAQASRTLHDINVIGTLQLLAACSKAENLRALVVRGSAAIYGSAAAAPSFFTEEMARRYPLLTRFQRDIGELEDYFDSFASQNPEIACCMLRFQPEIGPAFDNPLSRYLSLPVVPTMLGFDPRLQLLHAEDATGALAAAIFNPVRGAVNVAPDGSISLSRLIRLIGKVGLPVPTLIAGRLTRRLGGILGTADLYRDGELMLKYGRGCDNRRLREEVGYEPAFDCEGAARDFAGADPGLQSLFKGPFPGSPVRSVN